MSSAHKVNGNNVFNQFPKHCVDILLECFSGNIDREDISKPTREWEFM
jgi:hypothetical protein